jgi:hypothetical protein
MTQARDKNSTARESIARFSGRLGWVGFVLCALVVSGSGLLKPSPRTPMAKVESPQPGANRAFGLVTMIVWQAGAMRYAEDFAKTVVTPKARLAALACRIVARQSIQNRTRLPAPHPQR